jgi:hypothetical protein
MTPRQSVPSEEAADVVRSLIEAVGARPGLRLTQHPGTPEAGLYGDVFLAMSGALQGVESVDREHFGGALIPARAAYHEAVSVREAFGVSLERMVGDIDSGATSADTLPALMLQAMARFMQGALN